ncbi:type I-C CRISPR-associated endonuclease Cas1c [Coprobacter sp.]
MRKLLNTLYVTTPEAYLTKEGENVVVKVKDKEMFKIPALNLESIVSFGYMGASPALIKLCSDRNIGLCFISTSGQFQGRISGAVSGNVLLRRTQYRIADDIEKSLQISRILIAGKIANSRNIIERFKRDHITSNEQKTIFTTISDNLKRNKNRALTAENANILRGIEGEAANNYFSIFGQMIISQRNDFPFNGRNRRPPKDKVNALLSFVYTLLAHDIQSALESVGLDPYVGFLHTDRPGRAGLALDLMEELRVYLADRLVLSLINRKQISGKDFIEHGDNGVVMNDNVRKEVLTAWQKRKKETIIHPYLKESVPIGLIPYAQAMLLARFLRNDLDNYPVFLIT